MADYFTQWSVAVKIESGDFAWFKTTLTRLSRYLELANRGKLTKAEKAEFAQLDKNQDKHILGSFQEHDFDSVGFDVTYEVDPKTQSGVVYLTSEESTAPEQAVCILQCFLKDRYPDKFLYLEWANTCSKMRAEGFGGGAAFITANYTNYMTTVDWLDEQQKLSGKKEHK